MSSSDISALEEERQQLLKTIQDSNNNRFGDSRWVDRQARKINAKLDKKRKQMERNKKMMGFRKDVLLAETESLNSKIAEMETDRLVKIAHATSRLEEIEQYMKEMKMDTRSIRSRAPSPEILPSSVTTHKSGRTIPVFPDDVENNVSCRTEAFSRPRRTCNKLPPIFTSDCTNKIDLKPPYRKIIWKVTYNTNSPPSAAIPPPNPRPTDEKYKTNKKIAKETEKSHTSNVYIWKEYDHSEVFLEPDNPKDEDYDPSMDWMDD
ncbi:hypothetical protein BKA64DRAFT_639819 [Cadophora sp. MPI-SDFR-AT-0126]|nr:hypothetical protein BKA64DRAFT_639819 [Leotiomycetes sp. MPI-SDFR-AT-0126]